MILVNLRTLQRIKKQRRQTKSQLKRRLLSSHAERGKRSTTPTRTTSVPRTMFESPLTAVSKRIGARKKYEKMDSKSEISRESVVYWKSCCSTVDPRMFLFSAQLAISLLILIFCVVKLLQSDSCETQSLYGNILITLLGLWMPSPMVFKKK